MMDRRALLKLFGVGATIIPVVKGSPILQAPAQLVEVPKLIEVAQSIPTTEKAVPMPAGYCVVTYHTGQLAYTFKGFASSFECQSIAQPVDVTSVGDAHRRFAMYDLGPQITIVMHAQFEAISQEKP